VETLHFRRVDSTEEPVGEFTRVFVSAENRLFREAMSRLLGKKPDIEIVGCESPSPDLAAKISQAQAGTLVVGEARALRGNFQSIRELLRELPLLRIVLVGMEHDDDLFVSAVQAGVVGYVLKDASAQQIVEAVRAVSRSETACPSTLCFALFRSISTGRTSPPTLHLRVDFGLTRRERQLVPMIAEGLTNKEIAERLNLSEQTIKNHIGRLLRKAGVKNRLSAVDILTGEDIQI